MLYGLRSGDAPQHDTARDARNSFVTRHTNNKFSVLFVTVWFYILLLLRNLVDTVELALIGVRMKCNTIAQG